VARRSGLGKGLGSLIPAGSEDGGANAAALIEVPVASITPNPHQPRVHFDESALVELSASVAQVGVLQPILVRPVESSDDATRFELIAGERRWRAAQRAGLLTIPAIVRPTDDIGSVEQALVENLHRQDLTALEEAAAYQQLLDDFGLTHDALATRVGKSRSAISNSLRLLTLPPGVQSLLVDGQLSAGHARALLGLPDRQEQERIGRLAVTEGWSVRAVEQAVRAATMTPETAVGDAADDGPSGPTIDGAGISPRTTLRPPGLLELEELLATHLDTRVAVSMSAKRGRISVDFADLADLERIYRRMTGTD
jgi:ParB family chromosome partitioning protein